MKTILPSKTSKSFTSSSSILATLLLRTGLLSLSNLPSTLLSLSSPPDSSPLNSVLSAFARNSFPSLALATLSLVHRLALPLDSYSLCSSLSAAAAAISKHSLPGQQIQAVASKTAHLSNVFVCGALIDFYARTASLEDARKLFDESPVKNTVCANSLLNGYVESKLWNNGLSLFRTMELLGLTPDQVTLWAVLRICAEAAVVGLGRQAQGYLVRNLRGMGNDVVLLNCLVEMYGKCGHVEKARIVFELASRGRGGTDVFLWTSMLNVYGRNGWFDDVIRAFEEMLDEKTEPDHVVFLAVISACSRSGNVKKGLEFLELMGREYGLVPGPEHYGCIIDMLCRAGELEEVWRFANEVAVGNGKRFGVSVWGAILSACRDCGNVGIGVAAAQKALELDPGNVGILVELSNLYAKVGMWNEIGELREVIKERGLKKDAGSSWLEHVNYDNLSKAEVI